MDFDFSGWAPPPLRWQILDLSTLPVHDIEPYRKASTKWARRVRWARVNAVAIDIVQAANGGDLDPAEAADGRRHLLRRRRDREGLASLFYEPLDISELQITNGVHRSTEMRRQRATLTVALMQPDD